MVNPSSCTTLGKASHAEAALIDTSRFALMKLVHHHLLCMAGVSSANESTNFGVHQREGACGKRGEHQDACLQGSGICAQRANTRGLPAWDLSNARLQICALSCGASQHGL